MIRSKAWEIHTVKVNYINGWMCVCVFEGERERESEATIWHNVHTYAYGSIIENRIWKNGNQFFD